MEFPIYLAETEVRKFDCIKFIIPEMDLGVNGIEITAEYGILASDPSKVGFSAWARISDSSVRGFIFSSTVPSEGDAIQNIVSGISSRQVFFDHLHDYLDLMMDQK